LRYNTSKNNKLFKKVFILKYWFNSVPWLADGSHHHFPKKARQHFPNKMARFPASKLHLIPTNGIYPKGFLAGGAFAGIKKKEDQLDISVVYSPKHPCNVSAVFTKNKFCAAPVLVSKQVLSETGGKGIFGLVVNSGNANACTGDQGLIDAAKMSKHLKKESPMLVMSTGVIGQVLPADKVLQGLKMAMASAGSSHDDWMASAQGIMTTDTFPKLISREFKSKTGSYRMAGWSKGAGMSKMIIYISTSKYGDNALWRVY
jgi:glutamate N-acetyltransferase/amino-acid N-acetyltransferase